MDDQTNQGTGCILLIDDEPDICDIAQITLEQGGYEVLVAGDGEQGLQLFAENSAKIKLVLLDMTLPKTTGLEVLAQIKIQKPDTPVVIMSGYISGKSEAIGLGAQDALKKPFRLSELEELVLGILQ